jgi:hypothetical protein
MKKLMSILLGLSLVAGTAVIGFAADEKKEEPKKESKKKGKKGKKADAPAEEKK